jgi:hypothetical protein
VQVDVNRLAALVTKLVFNVRFTVINVLASVPTRLPVAYTQVEVVGQVDND